MTYTLKVLLSVILVPILAISVSVPAMAMKSMESDDGFSIEELPAFGEEDVIFFPSEATPEPEATEAPTTEPESPEENSIQEEKQLPQEEPAAESRPEEGESETIASSPAPETETVSSKQNNYPVIIIAAVLAVCAILFVIVKKRKPTKRRNG